MTGCALWLRVSTSHQTTDNQEPVLRQMAAQRGWDVVRVYRLDGASAWHSNADYDQAREQLILDAHQGQFQHLLCWSLDRLTRRGIEDVFRLVRQLDERGVSVVSSQDTWLGTAAPEAREIMLAIFASVAKFESSRRSERIKAGMERRRRAGLPVGRHPGAKDSRPRRRVGYVIEQERRRNERRDSADTPAQAPASGTAAGQAPADGMG